MIIKVKRPRPYGLKKEEYGNVRVPDVAVQVDHENVRKPGILFLF